jgi:hypothetical protein
VREIINNEQLSLSNKEGTMDEKTGPLENLPKVSKVIFNEKTGTVTLTIDKRGKNSKLKKEQRKVKKAESKEQWMESRD